MNLLIIAFFTVIKNNLWTFMYLLGPENPLDARWLLFEVLTRVLLMYSEDLH